jgi:transposase
MSRRHELSDEQWQRIAGLLPLERGAMGPPSKSNRTMANAMLWIVHTGAPWRDLPERFGPWKSVYTRFTRWQARGVWKHVLDELARDRDGETYMIDATIVRAHQDSAGAQKKAVRKPSDPRAAGSPQRFTLAWTPSEILSNSSSPKGSDTITRSPRRLPKT